jgi:tRNA A-37 threonylcarbamoyl transferase component Bud32
MADPADLLNTAFEGRYTIDRELGAGMMATVYLAEDLKHGRRVAIKVFRREFALTVRRQRFLREIGIAARLTHPNILPLYDSGEVDELLYYVMPYAEGESLRDRIARDQRLGVEDSVKISTEIADGLVHAHEAGVVHRDIKPENILLEAGHAVIADFGVALAASEAGTRELTAEGLSIGTPQYMSPEQVVGKGEVDGRSDVYAVGCVLYEMLVGAPPFTGPSVQAVLSQHLTARHTSARESVPAIPHWLEEVIDRSLEKQPKDRYQSAAELLDALAERGPESVEAHSTRRRTGVSAGVVVAISALGLLSWAAFGGRDPAPPGPAPSVLAVLPFESSGVGIDEFGDGMVDLLSAKLDGMGEIVIVPPRSVHYRWRTEVSEQGVAFAGSLDLARGLGAGLALTGSVVSTGPDVWLRAQITSVDGIRMAEASVTGPRPELLPLVDSLALQLIREAWSAQEPMPRLRVAAITTRSLPAAGAYLRGERHYRGLRWDSAVAALEEATAHDTTFALAYHRLSEALNWRDLLGSAAAVEAERRAFQNIERLPMRDRTIVRAKLLDRQGNLASIDTMTAYVGRYPDDPEGWYYLGDVQFHGWRLLGITLPELLRPFDRALTIEPRIPTVLIHPLEMTAMFGDSLRFAGYLDQLEALGERGQRYWNWRETIWGDGDRAEEALVAALREASPRSWMPPIVGVLFASAVDPSVILAALETASATYQAQDPAQRRIDSLRVSVLQALGRLDEADGVIEALKFEHPLLAATMYLKPVIAEMRGPRPDDLEALQVISTRTQPFVGAYWADLYALASGKVEALSVGDATDSTDAPEGADLYASLARALEGWRIMLLGDTAAAAVELQTGLLEAGNRAGLVEAGHRISTGPLRYRLALALVSEEETRAEGLRLLQTSLPDYEYLAQSFGLLGGALVHQDRVDEAAVAYGQVVRLWGKADADLTAGWPMVEARRTLGDPD